MSRRREKQKNTRFELNDPGVAAAIGLGQPLWPTQHDAEAALAMSNARIFRAELRKSQTFAIR